MLDTNIAVDLFERDPIWYPWSLEAVASAGRNAKLAVSAIVVGELAGHFAALSDLLLLLSEYGMTVRDLGADAAHRAGRAQADYRAAGGTRDKILGDFLIGAHAEVAGVALMTRDPRRFRRYFPDLDLITPEDDHG